MSPAWRRELWPILGLAFMVVALLYRSLIGGEIFSPAAMLLGHYAPWGAMMPLAGGNPLRGDDVFLFYPMLVSHLRDALHGHLPLWDLTKLGGTPAAWNGVNLGMYASPFTLILLAGGLGGQLGWYAFARLFVAGLGLYAYLRNQGLGRGASWAGGVVFMLNGLMINALSSPTPTIWAWMPWSLLAVDRFLAGGGRRWLSLFALFMGFQLLGAYVAHSFIYIVLVAAYALWRLGVQAMRRGPGVAIGHATGLALAGLAGASVGAIGLFPMLESMRQSTMASRLAGIGSFPPVNLMTYLAPNFFGNPALGSAWGWYGNYLENVSYVGILAIFLAVYGLWARRTGFGWFWAGAVMVTLLYQYGVPGFLQLGYLPGFRQIVPGRWHAVLITGMAVLAAWGIDALVRERKNPGPAWAVFACVSGACLCFGTKANWSAVVASHATAIVQDAYWFWIGTMVLATPVIALLATRRLSTKRGAVCLAALLAIDLFAFAFPFNPTTPRPSFYPQTPGLRFLMAHRTEGRILPFEHVLLGEIPGLFGLEAVTGYDVFDDRPLRQALASAGDGSLLPSQAVTSNDYLEVTEGPGAASVNELLLNVNPTAPLLGLLGVRYFVHEPAERLSAASLALPCVYRGSDMLVLENRFARPHAWFASNARWYPDETSLWAALAKAPSGGPDDVYLQGAPRDVQPQSKASGSVEILERQADREIVRTRAQGAGYLVLAERAHAGWKARVDGREVPILTAFGLLRAIAIQAGTHTVTFEYRPPLVLGSLLVSYVSMLVLLGLACWPGKRLSETPRDRMDA